MNEQIINDFEAWYKKKAFKCPDILKQDKGLLMLAFEAGDFIKCVRFAEGVSNILEKLERVETLTGE